ncbi:hypothetical protein Bequi_09980 [Brachybacterium sp. JHP9]|uniref:Uncharacterized protein n=1 Tax=Brachybacterium equifaecis TaxID=2910770 RepID=A0ABT0R1B0_9MICO|nr:hypothetical protein [Brachybacterium equifaecis]MCL6423712.1 hypothetical protein [Brachybacterium equifaecis]
MDHLFAPVAPVNARQVTLKYHLHVARGRTREKHVLLRRLELLIVDAAPSDPRFTDTHLRVMPSGSIYRGRRLLNDASDDQSREATRNAFELEHVVSPDGRVLSANHLSAGA